MLVTQTFNYGAGTNPEQDVEVTWDDTTPLGRWVVMVHGGSWAASSLAVERVNAATMAAAGFVVFNINYRLSTDLYSAGVSWPAPRTDILTAVQWAKARADQFGIEPNRAGGRGSRAPRSRWPAGTVVPAAARRRRCRG